jgi:hypothetical protein
VDDDDDDDTEWGMSGGLHPGIFVRGLHFSDPDGILRELARCTRPLGHDDVNLEPAHGTDPNGASGAEGDSLNWTSVPELLCQCQSCCVAPDVSWKSVPGSSSAT